VNEFRNQKFENRNEFIARHSGCGNAPFGFAALCLALSLLGFTALANSTNDAPATTPAPARLDESAFRVISERNIFNANRSGGTVRSTNSRRQTRVESFALVGTMNYEKGAFAFFEGTSSEYTKALKPDGIIAGYKVVDILGSGVKLEIGGQITELPIGSGMRREDQGSWKVAEVAMSPGSSNSGGSSESNGRDSRSGRSRRGDNGGDGNRNRDSGSVSSTASNAGAGGDQSEVLKRLMERREKEDQ
jgi:hypothetical protein